VACSKAIFPQFGEIEEDHEQLLPISISRESNRNRS